MQLLSESLELVRLYFSLCFHCTLVTCLILGFGVSLVFVLCVCVYKTYKNISGRRIHIKTYNIKYNTQYKIVSGRQQVHLVLTAGVRCFPLSVYLGGFYQNAAVDVLSDGLIVPINSFLSY